MADHITISADATRVAYVATSGQTAFTIPFEFFDEGDIDVYQNATLLTITTHYTITPDTTYEGGYDGGTVTLVTGATVSDSIVLALNPPITRTTDFPTSGAFNITTLNTWIDKVIVWLKLHRDQMSRKLGRPDSSVETYSLDWPDGAEADGRAIVVSTSGLALGPTNDEIANAQTYASQSAADVVSTAASASAAAASATAAAADAVDTAADAVSTASDAAAAASSASAASSSASSASTAQTAAETAQTAAETAQTAAETAQTAAETAEAGAESAVGSLAFKYTYKTTTTMTDPGVGELHFNNATISSATAIAFDGQSADTGNPDIEAYLDEWDASTSTVKGYLLFRESGDVDSFAFFSVTSQTENFGWNEVTVSHIAGTLAVTGDETLFVNFFRTGDKGDTGATGTPGAGVPSISSGDAGKIARVNQAETAIEYTADETLVAAHTFLKERGF